MRPAIAHWHCDRQRRKTGSPRTRARLYTALLALLIPTASFAQSPDQKAKAEAIHFLPRCPATDPVARKYCLENQRDFIEQYLLAKSGDVTAMDAVADGFRPEAPEFHRGLPISYSESCAWRRVVLRVAPNKDNLDHLHEDCDTIPEADEIASVKRSDVLMHELATAPTRPDALYRSVPRSQLDRTVTPLSAHP